MLQYNQNVLGIFEQNLRAHLEHRPMRNVASLPVPSPALLDSGARSTYGNLSTTQSQRTVYVQREFN
jgi:hypothetical protein